jgi:hypothetical protein
MRTTEIRQLLRSPQGLVEALCLAYQIENSILWISCPWHTDSSHSCHVQLDNHRIIAVGCIACGAHGDALSLIAAAKGLDARREFPRVLEETQRILQRMLLAASAPAAAAPAEAEKVAHPL